MLKTRKGEFGNKASINEEMLSPVRDTIEGNSKLSVGKVTATVRIPHGSSH